MSLKSLFVDKFSIWYFVIAARVRQSQFWLVTFLGKYFKFYDHQYQCVKEQLMLRGYKDVLCTCIAKYTTTCLCDLIIYPLYRISLFKIANQNADIQNR